MPFLPSNCPSSWVSSSRVSVAAMRASAASRAVAMSWITVVLSGRTTGGRPRMSRSGETDRRTPRAHPGHRNRRIASTTATVAPRPHARTVAIPEGHTRRAARAVKARIVVAIATLRLSARPAWAMRTHVVDGSVLGETVGFVAGDQRQPTRPVETIVIGAVMRRRPDQPEPGRPHFLERRLDDGEMEQCPGRCPHDLGVEHVDRAGRDHHGIGARPPRPTAGSCRGCRGPTAPPPPRRSRRSPARGRRPARIATSASRPVGVSVSLIRSATPGCSNDAGGPGTGSTPGAWY